MSFDQYQKMTKDGLSTVSVTKEMVLSSHRTLVVVYNTAFEERAMRFITSLNTTETIKADIITLGADGAVFAGLAPSTKVPKELTDSLVDTLNWLEEFKDNYEQVIEVNRWKSIL